MEDYEMTPPKIAIDQINRLSIQNALGISATAVNATIIAIALLGVVPKIKVLLWLAAALILCLTRGLLQKYFRTHSLTPNNVEIRKKLQLLLLSLSGCIWGALPIFLFPHSSMPHQILIAFVLGGMVAGSVAVFASIMSAFYAFSIPTIIPLAAYLLSMQDTMHLAMGSMLTVFWFFMLMSAKRLNLEILNFLVHKHDNHDLIENLEKEINIRQNAEAELKTQNQQIESIVNARTAELRQVNAKLLKEIDDRKEAEKALRASEEKYRELANSLPQMVFETDLYGNITFANRNTSELLGYSKKDFKNGLTVSQILAADTPEQIEHQFNTILEGAKPDDTDYFARRKDGSVFPIEIHSIAVKHSEKIVGMRGIFIDLTEKKCAETEQKQLEAQLQRAQKMEALGTMAGGVAHDLNNILSGIVSYPDLLLMQLDPDSPLRDPIEVMQESGKKAAAIVQDLLTLTRRGLMVQNVLNLNDIIKSYLESPEQQKLMSFHSDVHLDYHLESNLLNMEGSKVHLSKSLMNLISNAAEAMSAGGGRIQIRTENRYLSQCIKGYDAIKEGDYVVLSIKDNGQGISPEDIGRIFEPFFTKKKMGRSGTGLGMAVVWGTVKDHNGYIDVTSSEGMGSEFTIYFPATRKLKKTDAYQESISAYSGNGEAVLVVDDMKEQRQIASEMLLKLGYQVHTVSSGEDAVDYLQTHCADVIVLDMIMDPGMDGLDTFQQVLKLNPSQKTIIASGFSETERVKEAVKLGAGPYIKKPYTWTRLGQAVKSVLG